MPVIFRPDEEDEPSITAGEASGDLAVLREGLPMAARAAAVWVLIATPLLAGALYALRKPILAADRLLHGDGDYWSEMWMPAVLLAFFGAILGALTAWRVSARASIGGGGVCLISGLGGAIVFLAGAAAAAQFFDGPTPAMCWMSLGAMLTAWVAAGSAIVHVTH